jgi:hypothetical protein
LQDYRAILERQGNACGICKAPAKPLCIDHCHATGKVRGFLCRECNLGLGNYHDDPARMRAAAVYLEAARNPAPRGRGSWALRIARLVRRASWWPRARGALAPVPERSG